MFLLQLAIDKDGPIAGAWIEDLDADGRPDLLVQVGRRLDVHAALSSVPTTSILLDETPFVWTLCRLDGVAGLCVAFCSARGVFVVRGKDPEPLVVHPNLFEGRLALREAPVRFDFMPPIDGDDLSDLLLLGVDSTLVMVQRGGRFELRRKIALPVEATGELGWWPRPELGESVRVPFLYVHDLDGDGRRDVAAFAGERLEAWMQAEDGGFPVAPDRSLRVVKRRAAGLLKVQRAPSLADADGDGRADLVHVNTAQGSAEIFYGLDGADVEQREVGPWGIAAEIHDGVLVLRTVQEVKLLGAVDLLKERRATMQWSFYPLDDRGRPARTAAQTIALSVPFTADVSTSGFDLQRFFEPVLADVDGDGSADLVTLGESGVVRHPGDGRGGVLESPVPVAPIPAGAVETFVEAVDLDGDAKEDLLLRFRMEDGKDKLVLIGSKQGG